MKSFAFIALVAQVALLQTVCSEIIARTSPRGCGSNLISVPIVSSALVAGPCASPVYNPAPVLSASPIIPNVYSAAPLVLQPTDVAGSLADTLSLLTVSSLLAEKLPFNAPVIASVPVSSPLIGGCGYGYNMAGYYL